MKLIIESLLELPSQQFVEAINNIVLVENDAKILLDKSAGSLRKDLTQTFRWSISNEGHDYWQSLTENLKP